MKPVLISLILSFSASSVFAGSSLGSVISDSYTKSVDTIGNPTNFDGTKVEDCRVKVIEFNQHNTGLYILTGPEDEHSESPYITFENDQLPLSANFSKKIESSTGVEYELNYSNGILAIQPVMTQDNLKEHPFMGQLQVEVSSDLKKVKRAVRLKHTVGKDLNSRNVFVSTKSFACKF